MYALLHTTQNALFMQNYTSFVNFEKKYCVLFFKKKRQINYDFYIREKTFHRLSTFFLPHLFIAASGL